MISIHKPIIGKPFSQDKQMNSLVRFRFESKPLWKFKIIEA